MHLGTLVEISGHGKTDPLARGAISEAFNEVSLIHRLMSFHLDHSDVSRLNRDGARRPLTVDSRTVEVIRAACEISRLSDGYFDVTVAPALVHSGHLPQLPSACVPSNDASWRDIEIVSDDRVFFHQPLWLDLGGIAKGFAVDRAFQVCLSNGLEQCLVNAGGDIRISGGITGSVRLDVPEGDSSTAASVELTDGSIASSCGWSAARLNDGEPTGPHFDGVTGAKVDPRRFVSVLAQDCMVADALTKVVLVLDDGAGPVLSHFAATALVYDKALGWRQLPR